MTETPMANEQNPENSGKSPRGLLYGIGAIVVIGLAASAYVLRNPSTETATPPPAETTTAQSAAAPAENTATAQTDATATTGAPDLTVDEAGLSKAVVTMETTKGTIKYRFYSKDAPNTVARIVQLIQSGFYNGLTFHRVVPDFVIQGGDPQGNGTGGSGQHLKAEFNSRKHVAGTVAMARAQDPDSADSQFYIALGTIPHLDGSYTVFGQVSEGMDVVRKIEIGDKMTKVTVQ
ncbi:MAG: peptidylprolyl isomerase [Bdellovibrionales bacterium]|nr:peptidylprolyl isomerase [Bdellovibrionales bacterium]